MALARSGFLFFDRADAQAGLNTERGDLQNPALVDARPQHVRRRAHVFREVDVEPGDRGLQLGTGLGLEGELALDRPGDAGGEQRLLPGLRKLAQRREGLAVVLDRHLSGLMMRLV